MANVLAQPVEGLRVIELGHIVAGPTAGQILADLGADVIKVESPDGGDQARRMPGPMAAMFSFLNRNKRSVALDLKGEGKDVFVKLAADADVIIDNFAYGAIERLGIGYEEMSKANPKLIWLSIKGYLPGLRESQPMLDELAQMAGGLAFMTGTEDKPSRAGASVIDIGAATYGALAVLAALRQREIGGAQGQFITAGLYETSAYLVAQWMAAAQYAGEPSVPLSTIRQGARMGFAIYRLFGTADGSPIFVGITSNAHWERFCKVFERLDLLQDSRFSDNALRLANRNVLNPMLEDIFSDLPLAQVDSMLREAKIPCSPMRRPDQLAEEIHLNESGQLLETELANGKRAKLPKLPIRATGFDMPLRREPPVLGEDTRDVLEELGYSSSEIGRLIQIGAVLEGQ
jgi:crotonobetainyl-CoA:carnitine CoA-transferase CaiB-like acyl-CoA transferase